MFYRRLGSRRNIQYALWPFILPQFLVWLYSMQNSSWVSNCEIVFMMSWTFFHSEDMFPVSSLDPLVSVKCALSQFVKKLYLRKRLPASDPLPKFVEYLLGSFMEMCDNRRFHFLDSLFSLAWGTSSNKSAAEIWCAATAMWNIIERKQMVEASSIKIGIYNL